MKAESRRRAETALVLGGVDQDEGGCQCGSTA
jgi:hypothetical protein